MIQEFHFWIYVPKTASQGPYGNMNAHVHRWCFALLGIDDNMGVTGKGKPVEALNGGLCNDQKPELDV